MMIDSCLNKVSADQVSCDPNVGSSFQLIFRSHVFVKLTADQVLIFRLDRVLMLD